MLQLRPGAHTSGSCCLGIHRERAGRGGRQQKLVLTVASFEPMSFLRSKKRKVSNCPVFSAENTTGSDSWQVPPLLQTLWGGRERKNNKVHPWGGFLPDLGVVGSVHHQACEQGWLGLGFHQIHSSEGSVPLREMGKH